MTNQVGANGYYRVVNSPPPSEPNKPATEPTSRTIARYFSQLETEGDAEAQANKTIPAGPPIDRPPVRRPPSHPAQDEPSEHRVLEEPPPGSDGAQPKPWLSSLSPESSSSDRHDTDTYRTGPSSPSTTRKMPVAKQVAVDHRHSRPTPDPPKRRWLFGAAFATFTVLGIGLAVTALSVAANITDNPGTGTGEDGNQTDILPQDELPFGVATIEGEERTATSLEATPRRQAPAPTTKTERTSTTVEQTTVQLEETGGTDPGEDVATTNAPSEETSPRTEVVEEAVEVTAPDTSDPVAAE